MKKAFTVLILISILPVIQVYAQEKDTNLSRPSVRLELIHYYDQNQLSDGGVFLSEIITALGRKEKGIPQEDIDWLLNKIRLDIVRQTKKLYTNNGTEIDVPYCAYLPYSSNYRYFILNTCDYQDRIARNQRTKLIRTSDGKVMWELEGKMMAYATISNDGSITVEQQKPKHPEGNICGTFNLYNSEGNLVKVINGLVSLPMRYTLSDHGNMLVIIASEDKGDYCIGFDKSGNELWKTQVPHGSYDDETRSFFNSDRYFLYSTYSNGAHSLLVDDSGSIIGHYDFIIRQGIYTDDGRDLIFEVKNDSVHYLNIQNAEVLHERIVDGLTANTDHYFVNMFDKLDVEGTIMLSKSGIVQGIYLKQGEVSPNKHIIITPTGILFLEVKNAK